MTQEESQAADQAANRDRFPLAPKLDKNLVAYALAATTAGVGIMALTQTAEARVIATRTHIVVPINGGVIQFDINGDGIPDFGLSATSFATSFGARVPPRGRPPLGGVAAGHLRAVPAQTANEVCIGGGAEPLTAAALPPDIQLGAGRHFDEGNILMEGIILTGCEGTSFAYGNWKGHPLHHFLGVKFTDTTGNVHYGWVRILVTENGIKFNATIEGYAYETVPNKPIVTGATSGPVGEASLIGPSDSLSSRLPQPASLGMLALGTPGLVAWRRQDEEKAA